MAFDYSGLDAVAVRLIDQFGRTVVARRSPSSPPIPTQPWNPAPVATVAGSDNATVRAVEVDFTVYQLRTMTIEALDARWLIAATGAPVDLGTEWELVDGAIVLKVVKAKLIRPGDTPIYWDVQVRV